MSQHVGRLTLAFALMIIGVSLIIDNLLQTEIAVYVGHLWPVLLMALGLEWIWAAGRLDAGQKMRMDLPALIMLGLVAVGLAAWSEVRLDRRWRSETHRFPPRIESHVPSPPSPPSPPSALRPPFLATLPATVETTYDTFDPAVNRIEISDSSAGITVRSGSKLQVKLKATGYGSSETDAQENARSLRLQVTAAGGAAKVSVERLRTLNRFGLTYEVEVPSGVNVTVRSSSGSVVVEGIDGAVDVTAASGHIRIGEIAGSVSASSSSGSMDLERISGNLKANANSGSIRIKDVQGAVSAQASSGSIQVESLQVGGPYDLTASSGGVRLKLPGSANVAVKARASSGTVTGPRWLTIGEGRNSGSGALGTGQHEVTIRTSSGSIHVDAE